ncbi:hypothetical protein [Aquabacterium sp.]|uniref:hypothetical protein n=1 Tax=Aquabacterium sp. TaxID=1872578 RepID=UPI0025C0AAE9|nr:hypothetical protein [Aquabacterium sp.]
MDLKLPITITDELSDDLIKSTGLLDLASGEITRVEYEDHDVALLGLPCEAEDYEFTCGILSNHGKEVEFGIKVNKTTGQYSVSADELLEIKVRAAALFAGISGQQMAESTVKPGTDAKPAAAKKAPAKKAAKPRGSAH